MAQSSTTSSRGRKSATQDKKGASSRSNTGSRSNSSSRSSNRSSGPRSSANGNQGSTMQRTTGSSGSTAGRGRSSRQTGNHEDFQGTSYLEKFFLDQLMDIYYAEQKIVQSLPKLKQAATTEELQEAFEDHLHQSERHVKRLEKVFQTLGKKAEGKKCEAIEGITREVEQIIGETEEGSMTRDAALIIAAQKVEHYEIATYGGLVQLAITMQLHDAADLLDKTLMEEEDTDARLTEIAENEVNLGAEHEGNQYSWDKDSQEGETDEQTEGENDEEQ